MGAHKRGMVGRRNSIGTVHSEQPFGKRHSQRRFHTQLQCESLESRNLLSATATPEVEIQSVSNTTVSGLTASQVSAAYGFNKSSDNGAGQTIAIIDAYNDPNIKSDLATFDSKMGLPTANLTVVNQSGGTALPQTDSGWDLEIALDVEWAHAMAPDANILLVEANSDNLTDLLSAVQHATTVSAVSVVSMSWGSSEFNGETSYDSYFTTPAGHQGITFVGASGDSGSPGIWPAISSNVLAVGGTTLTVSSAGAYESETSWSDSGGGTSLYESEPSWQTAVQSTGKRTSPDVSYDANPNTGFAVYDSVATSGQSGWFEVGGTSDAAPQWAALLADANQGRVAAGETTLNGAQAAIYSLPSTDFHDITSGSNGGYSAKAGYDEVTGRGTPIANSVISGLISYTTGSTSSGSGSGSSGSGSSGSGSSGSGSSGSGSSGSGSSGSGGGSSGGSHGGGFGGYHNPFSGFGGFGGFSGFGGFYSGFFDFGGRLDEIGSSSADATAVVNAFVTTELAQSEAGAGQTGASNSLAGIQQINAAASSVASGAAVFAAPGDADQAPAQRTAFAALPESDATDGSGISVTTIGLGGSWASHTQTDLTAAGATRSDGAASVAPNEIVSQATFTSRETSSGEADSRDISSRDIGSRSLVGVDSVELSPAMLKAVWSSLDIDIEGSAMFATSAGADATMIENGVPAGIDAMTYSSPLAMVMAGVALHWAKSQVEDRLKPPARQQWPGKKNQQPQP